MGGVELIGGSGAAQCSEEVEPSGLEVVLGESLRQSRVREVLGSEQSTDEPHGCGVKVGALAAPLGEDAVDVITLRLVHRGRIAAQWYACKRESSWEGI